MGRKVRGHRLGRPADRIRTRAGLPLPGVVVPRPGCGRGRVPARGGRPVRLRRGRSPDALLEDADRIGAEGPDRRWLLVIDALDEAPRADDRDQIAVLAAQLARRPWVRAVVATRPLSAQGPTGEASLLQRLGVHDPDDDHLVKLDNDSYFDDTDVEGMAGQLLTQADQAFPIPGTAAETYRADSALRERLARVIAETARRNFLVAGMTASRLADTRAVVDPAAPGFDITALPASVGGALNRFLDSRDDGAQLRGVLTALAYAEGTGMDDRTWLNATDALGYPATQAGLDALRATRIADYLLQTTTETDGRVIRLFHQVLADQFRRGRDTRADQDAITTALLHDGQRRGWAHTVRYPLRYLAAHAAAVGRINELLADLDFLLHADLADIRRALTTPQPGQPVETAAVLLSAGAAADELAPEQRAELLALHAAHLGLPGTMHEFNATATWQTSWAHSLGSHRTTLHGHTSWVTAVAAVPLPGGRMLLASASHDRTVRLWDPVTGTPAGNPLHGHTGQVTAVAAVPLPGGRVLLASASHDRTVRLWDPVTGTPAGGPLHGHTGTVTAVAAVAVPGGRVLLASASDDRTVRLWDPATGNPADVIHLVNPASSLTATHCQLVVTTGRGLAVFVHRRADHLINGRVRWCAIPASARRWQLSAHKPDYAGYVPRSSSATGSSLVKRIQCSVLKTARADVPGQIADPAACSRQPARTHQDPADVCHAPTSLHDRSGCGCARFRAILCG